MSNNGRRFSKDITGEHKNTINKVSASAKNTLRCLNTASVHFLLKCNKKEIKAITTPIIARKISPWSNVNIGKLLEAPKNTIDLVAIGCSFELHRSRKWPSFQYQFQSEVKQNQRDCFGQSVAKLSFYITIIC